MAVDTLTEGSDRNTARRVTRMIGANAGAPSTIGVMAPSTGGGSAGLGCADTDGADAMERRLRGTAAVESGLTANNSSFQHWSPA